MPQTWGVPVEEIVRGIRHGVRKVNIDTDCRLAMTAAFRKVGDAEQERVRPAQIPQAGDGRACASCAANASSNSAPPAMPPRIKVVPLAEMAKRYRSGALDPRIGGDGRRRRMN